MITQELLAANQIEIAPEIAAKLIELSANATAPILKQRENEAYSKALGLVDNTFVEMGIEKPNGMKTTELLKNILTDYKSVKDVASKVKDYEEQIKNSPDKSEFAKQAAKIKEYELQLNHANLAVENVKKEYAEKIQKDTLSNMLKNSLPQIKKDVPTELAQLAITDTVNRLLQFAKIADTGDLVFIDSKGEIMRNPTNAMKPTTISDILSTDAVFKNLIETGEGKNATGIKTGTTPQPSALVDFNGIEKTSDAIDLVDNFMKRTNDKALRNPTDLLKRRTELLKPFFDSKKV